MLGVTHIVCYQLLHISFTVLTASFLYLYNPLNLSFWYYTHCFQEAMPQGSRAKWNNASDGILLEVLFRKCDSGGQTSNRNWHTSAWTEAEKKLAGSELLTGGVPKTAQICENRWGAVCLYHFSYLTQATLTAVDTYG
jgi:hypothetical protein